MPTDPTPAPAHEFEPDMSDPYGFTPRHWYCAKCGKPSAPYHVIPQPGMGWVHRDFLLSPEPPPAPAQVEAAPASPSEESEPLHAARSGLDGRCLICGLQYGKGNHVGLTPEEPAQERPAPEVRDESIDGPDPLGNRRTPEPLEAMAGRLNAKAEELATAFYESTLVKYAEPWKAKAAMRDAILAALRSVAADAEAKGYEHGSEDQMKLRIRDKQECDRGR